MPLLLALLPIWNVVRAAFTAVVGFLLRRPGIYLLTAALIVLAIWWSGERGFKRGQQACEDRHQTAALHEVNRQSAVIYEVRDRSDARTQKSIAINHSNEKVLVHVKDQLQALPDRNADCIPADIADGLRSLQ